MKTVLHLRATQGLYGADNALLALAGATAAPYLPVVGSLARAGRPNALAAAAAERGLSSLPLTSEGKLDGPLLRRLLHEVRARDVALLHAHDYKALALASVVGAVSGVPVVATYHGDTGASPALIAYEKLAHLLGNLTRRVAVVSRQLEARLQRWAPFARVAHIPNGIGPVRAVSALERQRARKALGVPEDAEVLGVLGRLSKEKGQAVLLRALRRMKHRPTLLLAGDGPDRAHLEQLAAGLPVQLLGFQHNVRRLYAALDVLVLPSLTEGLPLVALEAMAHGRAVVASAVGELPELLKEGAGWCVQPGDPGALARALDEALGSPERRAAVAEAGRARVRAAYSVEAMARAYAERLYGPALVSGLG